MPREKGRLCRQGRRYKETRKHGTFALFCDQKCCYCRNEGGFCYIVRCFISKRERMYSFYNLVMVFEYDTEYKSAVDPPLLIVF